MPESSMLIGHELMIMSYTFEWIALEEDLVIIYIVEYFFIENHESSVDP